MKRLVIILFIAAALVIAFLGGRSAGIRHAIEDSKIWAVEVYNPESPEESAWNGYDQEIFIELDGEIYSHGMTQC